MVWGRGGWAGWGLPAPARGRSRAARARPGPPTESTIRDWDDADPSGQTYHRVLFIDSDLTEVDNRGGIFEECTFRGVRFNVSEHRASAFLRCTFSRCSFFDASFDGCKLDGSVFAECTMRPLKVIGGSWRSITLRGEGRDEQEGQGGEQAMHRGSRKK